MDADMEILMPGETTLARVGDRDRQVSEAAQEAYLAARPANTERAYSDIWAKFEAWCDHELRIACPATPETLMEYVHQLTTHPTPVGKKPIAPGSVEQAIAAIRTYHAERGFKGHPESGPALRVLKGYRRGYADAGARAKKAPPILAKTLRQMVWATPNDTLTGIRDRALLVIGWNMMARRSELVALNLDELVEEEDDLVVYVRSSKTDQLARGREVRCPRGQYAETCPMRLHRAWADELRAEGYSSGRLFRSIDRHGIVGESLSGDAVNRIVRAAAVRAELPRAEEYTAHSLRSGAATQARRNGADMSAIAEHGRWNPHSPVVYGYIRAEDQRAENVMRGSGL